MAGDFVAKLQMVDVEAGGSQAQSEVRMVDNATDSQAAALQSGFFSLNRHPGQERQRGLPEQVTDRKESLDTLGEARQCERDLGGENLEGITASRGQSLKFVIIGSGYELRTPEHTKLKEDVGSVQLPSLHGCRPTQAS